VYFWFELVDGTDWKGVYGRVVLGLKSIRSLCVSSAAKYFNCKNIFPPII